MLGWEQIPLAQNLKKWRKKNPQDSPLVKRPQFEGRAVTVDQRGQCGPAAYPPRWGGAVPAPQAPSLPRRSWPLKLGMGEEVQRCLSARHHLPQLPPLENSNHSWLSQKNEIYK